MNKEVIYLEKIANCSGAGKYIYQLLLGIRDVLSVKIDIHSGKIEVYHVGNYDRNVFLKILAKKGFTEKGAKNIFQKSRAYLNSFIGLFL